MKKDCKHCSPQSVHCHLANRYGECPDQGFVLPFLTRVRKWIMKPRKLNRIITKVTDRLINLNDEEFIEKLRAHGKEKNEFYVFKQHSKHKQKRG